MIDLLCPLPTRASHTNFLSGGVFRGRHTQAGVRVDEDLAMTYSACWCATRIIMESIGNLPLHLDLRDPQHTAYEDTDHPHALLVSSQPNPEMGSHVFRQGRTNHQVNWGNGFAEIERVPPYTPESRALALWPIHPSRVYPASEEKQAQGYAYRVSNNDGSDTDLMPHELLHIPGAHSEDGIWGKGVIAYAREDVGAGLGMNRHGATAVGSGNMPKVVAFVPHMRDREARQSYREEWQEVHGHPDAAAIGLLPDTAKLQVLNFSNEDAQYIQNRQFNVIEVARWYNLPPHSLKHLDNAIKANIEEQAIEVVITGLIPWAVLWEEQLGLKLLTPQERVKYHFRHRFEGLLRGDFKRRMEAYEVGLRCGVLTLNLIYRLEGWPEIGPMGDEHYVPVGWTTADRIHKGLPPPSTQTEALGAEKGKNKDVKKKQEQRIARSVLHKLASTVWNGSGTSYLLPQHDARGSEKSGTGQPRPTEATGGVASPVGAERVAALAASKDAASAVLQHTLSRLFTKEANAARRAVENKDDFDAWLEAFYLKHQALAAEELAPAVLALKAAGVAQDAAALAQACCTESRELLTASYNADTPTAFKAKLAAWPTERAARTVTALLGDDHA